MKTRTRPAPRPALVRPQPLPPGSETPATVPLDVPAGSGAGGAPDVPGSGPAPAAPPLYPSGEPGGSGTLPPPPYYGATPSYGATPPQGGAQSQSFFDWVRSQGINRGRDRWVGGVASGIAQRLGVDPLIVRGIFIVLAIFAGVGVLLYGLAWALLPEPDGRIHVQEAAAGRWSGGMTGALITALIGLPGLGSGVWGWDRHGFGGFIWTVFWLGGIGYLVYYLFRRNKTPNGAPAMSPHANPGGPVNSADPAGQPGPGQAHAAPAASFATTSHGSTSHGSTPYGSTVPGPGWGAPPPSDPTPPPGGGYRPGPGGPVPPAKPRNLGPGAPAVAVTAGVALLVGGGIKALDAANVIDLGDSSNAIVWASGAAVLGLGILFAGLRGRTSGILGFFAAVALIIGGIFNVVPNGDRFRFQDADWSPASIEQARDGFEITGGRGTVDLTRLALNPPLGSDVVIPIDVTASNVTVVIPETVPVQIHADMTMGNLNEGGRSHGGMTTQQNDYNTGQPGARLILRISGTVSNVTIQEGN
ncbi:phage shock protein PspC (stress-responsive transcriptional regulator) [Arthrobacter sp. V4I6]|uniref:PspC domain-containing protein n=1 Tax=Arthrobacter sp. V4I6 TaxID=3042281 RepID=UPI00277F753C|nr:PspC domain-containing protein [Arthrobacter sp. V4I6]MDQ0854114.1 phage shock protein PspC (stress-responsive transcriptional regulator) [Arthrobacter sp. V4I6]